jgi:4a-hydroxytetrahydrobiopterin dehydratase
MSLLTHDQIEAFGAAHPDWAIKDEMITRTFTFDDFAEALGFVTRVGVAAERVFHHPDIDIRWNQVTLTLSSHDVGGLTERDTELAARISLFVSGS